MEIFGCLLLSATNRKREHVVAVTYDISHVLQIQSKKKCLLCQYKSKIYTRCILPCMGSICTQIHRSESCVLGICITLLPFQWNYTLHVDILYAASMHVHSI